MLAAGQRNHRVRFERRVAGAKSPSGNMLEAWSALFERWAGMRPQFGREALAVGQLQATMRGFVTVLADPQTQGLTAADRVVFVTGPYRAKKFRIVSTPVPGADAREIEITVEEGGQS